MDTLSLTELDYLDFFSFYLVSFFLSQDLLQETTLHLVIMSPKAPLGCDCFSDFPCSQTLTVLRSTGHLSCGISIEIYLFFTHDRPRACVLGRKTTSKAPFSLHLIKGSCYQRGLL